MMIICHESLVYQFISTVPYSATCTLSNATVCGGCYMSHTNVMRVETKEDVYALCTKCLLAVFSVSNKSTQASCEKNRDKHVDAMLKLAARNMFMRAVMRILTNVTHPGCQCGCTTSTLYDDQQQLLIEHNTRRRLHLLMQFNLPQDMVNVIFSWYVALHID